MFTIFNSKSLWIGKDLKKFNQIRWRQNRSRMIIRYITGWGNGAAGARCAETPAALERLSTRCMSMISASTAGTSSWRNTVCGEIEKKLFKGCFLWYTTPILEVLSWNLI